MLGAIAARRRAASASPWASLAFTEANLGAGEYQFTKATGTTWEGFANLTATGDFRVRIQPQQNNVAVAVGLDEVMGAVVDTGSLAEHCNLRSDTGYSGSTGYVPDSAVTYGYAANDIFWFERIGTVSKIYKGGDGTIGTAALFYTWATDTSDSNVLKVLLRDQGGAVRVRYEPL